MFMNFEFIVLKPLLFPKCQMKFTVYYNKNSIGCFVDFDWISKLISVEYER